MMYIHHDNEGGDESITMISQFNLAGKVEEINTKLNLWGSLAHTFYLGIIIAVRFTAFAKMLSSYAVS